MQDFIRGGWDIELGLSKYPIFGHNRQIPADTPLLEYNTFESE